METIRVGIIGAGGIAHTHLRTLQDIPGVQVLAIADVVPGKAQEVAYSPGV